VKQLKPPVIATWLLDRFGVTRRNEALAGDLIEEFHSSNSRAWYWAQALIAILVNVRADLWAHKLLGIRAILVGEIASTILTITFANALTRWGPRFTITSATWWLCTLGAALVINGVSGWLVGRLHRPHGAVMAVLFAVTACCLSVWWNSSLWSIHLTNSIDSPRFRLYLAFDILYQFVSWLAVIIGGLASDGRRGQARSSPA
jgi:hypothetical protein